ASKIPLLTYAEYLADPASYDPDAAWERALAEVAGPASAGPLRRFAENSTYSCLQPAEAEALTRLAGAAVAALERGEPVSGPAVAALQAYLDSLDEAVYHLRNRLSNLALRQDLLPWLEVLEHWYQLGRRALEALAAQERG